MTDETMTAGSAEIAIAEFEMFTERQLRKAEKSVEMMKEALKNASTMRQLLRLLPPDQVFSETEALPIHMLTAMVETARNLDDLL